MEKKMNTYTQTLEQVPCIKLIDYKVSEDADHTFTVETTWEDQCHHDYVKFFHDSGDDAQGVWTESVEGLESLQHAAAEVKIQEYLHAKQGGWVQADAPLEVEEKQEVSQLSLFLIGLSFSIVSGLLITLIIGSV